MERCSVCRKNPGTVQQVVPTRQLMRNRVVHVCPSCLRAAELATNQYRLKTLRETAEFAREAGVAVPVELVTEIARLEAACTV